MTKYIAPFFILFLMSLTACGGQSAYYVDAGAPVQGPKGDTGAAGTNGQDATPTIAIKLCPDAPSYPAVFVEYALCINNELYAVYSANGGFLALLPPGSYSSNGIGSACGFTVDTNCSVSH